MKNNILIVFAFFLLFTFNSCSTIDDEYLDPDILIKFKQERGTYDESDYEQEEFEQEEFYSEKCKISVSPISCVFKNECTYRIELSGESKLYKYFFSDTYYSDDLTIPFMKSLDYIEGQEYNFVSMHFQYNPRSLYLYCMGYSDENTHGDIVVNICNLEGPLGLYSSFTGIIDITSFRKEGKEITWKFSFPDDSYKCQYLVLFDEDAEFADKLEDSALALYMEMSSESKTLSLPVYNPQQAVAMKTRTMAINGTEKKVLIVTRAYRDGYAALAVKRKSFTL